MNPFISDVAIDDQMSYDLLLALQDLREVMPDWFTSIMLFVSSTPFYLLIPVAMAVFVFLCVDKRSGEWMMMNISLANYIGHLLKDVVANPRPWVEDDRIVPEERALGDSAGYSTPSGHTVCIAAGLGTLITILKKRWATVLFLAMILIVMFSRLYLGVHTLLDVVSGALFAAIIIAINWCLIRISYRDENRYIAVAALYAVIVITATMIWVLVTDDYDSLLKTGGFIIGTMVGRVVEHQYIGYEVRKTTVGRNVCRLLIGLLTAGVLLIVPYVLLGSVHGSAVGGLLSSFGMFVIAPKIIMTMGLNE